MRKRILSALLALAVALGIGGFALAGAGAAVRPAQVLSTTDRGLCIENGTGKPQSLWLVESTGACPAGFWGPASLKDAFGIDVDALVKAEVAKQIAARTVKAADPVPDELAPVLSTNGAATATTVRIKWIDAKPDAGETIANYIVQQKASGATWSTAVTKTATEATNGITIGSLSANTSYVFRVRAEYVARPGEPNGADGPWSNELTVKTAEA